MPAQLIAQSLPAIIRRVFVERRSSVLSESTGLCATDLADLCLALRARMLACLKDLPDTAFVPSPDRQHGEPGWTAGEIVSHNTDRLLWALSEVSQTVGLDPAGRSSLPEAVVRNAARDPLLLDRELAVRTLQEATDFVKVVFPPLIAADRGQTAARTHHGPMNVTSWLLLICIHDTDHLCQLHSRHP